MLLSNSPATWLKDFLIQRSLSEPNGNPLFSYQMTHDEYRQLFELVRDFHPKTNVSWSKHKDWSACFVIYCSEWYRRDCCAQKWEWFPLWQRFHFELTASQRADIIPLGLEGFWKRPIRRYESDTRNFLGSIFIEGGLPFKLISSTGNKFSEAIRKLLKLYYQVDLYAVSITELVKSQLGHLPVVFSEPESVELIGSVVKNLMTCAGLVDSDVGEESPSMQLDQKSPGWRDSFPIPLDDETGKGLLDNWLLGATNASKVIKDFKDKLSCEHFFDKNTGRFYTQISLPRKLTFRNCSEALESTYTQLGLLEGTKRIAELGGVVAQIDNGNVLVPPRKKSIKVPRRLLSSSLFTDLSQSGIVIGKVEVNESSISFNEAPLGFLEDEGELKLVGQGSFSTKYAEILVFAPLAYEIEILSGYQEYAGKQAIDGVEFNWFRVNGDSRFYHGDNRFRIRTNSTSTSSGSLYIEGAEILLKTLPSKVYKGVPSVRDAEGTLASQLGLSTLLNNKPVESLAAHELYGKHYLSVKNKESDTLLRRTVAIVPDDLDIEAVAVKDHAQIKVTSSRNLLMTVYAQACRVENEKLENGRLFEIYPEAEPPSSVTLEVQANLMEDPIIVTLPFPASGMFAFDSEGKPLKTELTVEQLLGAEVNLYSAKSYPEDVSIELALKPNNRTSPRYQSKVKVKDRTLSVSLYSFKEKIIELMSLSNNLDAEVEICLSGLSDRKVFSIRRYISSLNFDSVGGGIALAQSELAHGDLKPPMAMLIAEPERPPLELPEKEIGGISLGWFNTTEKMEKTGPWMIVPSSETPHLFRPTFYKGAEPSYEQSVTIKSLQTAVKQFNPRSEVNSIEKFLTEMEGDFTHPSWDYCRKLWEHFSYLPLSTFEVWKALVKNPHCLTVALFRFEMNEEFIRALDREFSILWELIPISVWQQSILVVKKAFLNLGLPTSMVEERVEVLLDKFYDVVLNVPEPLIKRLKGIEVNCNDYLAERIVELIQDPERESEQFQLFRDIGMKRLTGEAQLTEQEMFKVIDIAMKQPLLRNHKDSDWPSFQFPLLSEGLSHRIRCDLPHHASVINYPLIAAAIAAGYVETNPNKLSAKMKFEIKQVKMFAPDWFSAVYAFGIGYYSDCKEEVVA
ncbi:hypothetical protein AMBAS45_07565 [Alteromonas macleodii str. 'Balearic Sea AD45']|uniref:STY4851/ECs_5259 family protein n=1 Tax=Alteromonas macleodii TaxID=28108 RepID=UPI000286D6F5|nr:STY4851/ECs_5259 family protein [Alteromonas macleodii]AFT94988.1 hypothetical protein AMBAS45_07565 [Alteromonas macleodii str. 'Balearic Sea AD45']